MTSLRSHLDGLDAADDLLTVMEHVHWDGEAAEVAREAITNNGPAVLFEETPGRVRFVSGAYGGPDQVARRGRAPWARIGEGLGLGDDPSYDDVLRRLSTRSTDERPARRDPMARVHDDVDLHSLGLPSVGRDGRGCVTLGILAASREGTTSWVPVRGEVRRSHLLRLVVSRSFVEWFGDEGEVSLVLGIPVGAHLAGLNGWTRERVGPDVHGVFDGIQTGPVASVDGRYVPASAEVRIDGSIRVGGEVPSEPGAAWERACRSVAVDLTVESIALREDPIVEFAPLGSPLSDDLHMTSLVEAAHLFVRVNNYWGISPVRWVRVPVETRLAMCFVSSEILYAGFEWQLANTLFSFSNLFDKVLVLDADADPSNLARAFDDMWVKAHPANDWIFSEPNAPASTAPSYDRADGTGSRLYIDATWDPRWEEEYIAPRVTFDRSYPEDVRTMIRDRFSDLGFERRVE